MEKRNETQRVLTAALIRVGEIMNGQDEVMGLVVKMGLFVMMGSSLEMGLVGEIINGLERLVVEVMGLGVEMGSSVETSLIGEIMSGLERLVVEVMGSGVGMGLVVLMDSVVGIGWESGKGFGFHQR